MKSEYQDKIDEYLLGRMTPEEGAEFEEKTHQNLELNEQLEFTRLLKDELKSKEKKRRLMHQWEQENALQQNFKKVRSRIRVWISGMAAILIIGLVIGNAIVFTHSTNTAFPTPYVDAELYRGDDFMQQAANLINEKKYSEALAYITDGMKDTKKCLADTQKKLLTTNPEHEELVEELQYKVVVYEADLQSLTWVRANALCGLGQLQEALDDLETLKGTHSPLAQKADSLYQTIKTFVKP